MGTEKLVPFFIGESSAKRKSPLKFSNAKIPRVAWRPPRLRVENTPTRT
jgi:hypothetical protein